MSNTFPPVSPPRPCACGCGGTFTPRLKSKGGVKWYPEYIRGHHPNCRKTQTGNKPAWNTGLKKGDHPSIKRMGFQPGHEPYTTWEHVNERLRSDPQFRERWLTAKRRQEPWNKGMVKSQYPNGFCSTRVRQKEDPRAFKRTTEYKVFRRQMYERDSYTCQHCGHHSGNGVRCDLELDHIVPVWEAPDRIMDPENVRTLCKACHRKTETFGTKGARLKRKKLSGGSH